MKDNYKLSDIYLGLADGEAESQDERFMDMFYTGNNKCEELNQSSKFIIRGRKGTGKTVLARYYQITNEINNQLLVSKYGKLKDFSLHELIEFGDKKTELKELSNFQIYYLYKEIACSLIENKKNLRKFNFNIMKFSRYRMKLSKLKKFYYNKYDDEIHEVVSSTQNEANTIEAGIKKSKLNARAEKTSYISKTKQEKPFYKIEKTLERAVLSVLSYVNILIIIDDFDDYFIDDRQEIKRFLINFVNNVKTVNSAIKKVSKNNRCILLMRDDVIDTFACSDANIQKTIFDGTVNLIWHEGSSQIELKKMICNKIKNSNEKFKNCNIKELESLFFPSDMNIMNHKGKTQNKSFFNSVMELGFGRPRDVILLLNTIVNKNPNEDRFSFGMIKDAAMDYSNHFLSELKNEMHFHFDEKYILTAFQVLSDFKKIRFKKKEIELFIINNYEKYTMIDDIDIYLDTLYKLGIIGYFVPYGKSMKSGYHTWSYFSNAAKNIDLNSKLIVHKGLQRGLNI